MINPPVKLAHFNFPNLSESIKTIEYYSSLAAIRVWRFVRSLIWLEREKESKIMSKTKTVGTQTGFLMIIWLN